MKSFILRSVMVVTICAASIVAASPYGSAWAAEAIDTQALIESANAGRFDDVLRSLSDPSRNEDASIASLKGEIENFQTHRQRDHEVRIAAYEKTLAEMNEKAQADDLYEALVSAIKAHGLATSPAQMLSDPSVETLVSRTKKDARGATDREDWLEALNLYRALDLLFEEEGTYRDQVKRAVAHVRVLRMYAPHALHELAVERAKRRGKDIPEFQEDEDDEDSGWEQQLDGVEAMMLRAGLKHAQRRHVHHPALTKLLDGTLESLDILAHTPALAETFAALNDPAKVRSFTEGIAGERKRLAEQKRMTFWDAIESVDRMIDLNQRTLKLPDKVVVYEMTQGMTSTLDDFTSVIWPYDKEQFSRNTSGRFFGVGIQISMRDERLIVVTPLHGTPAFKAGIKPGDIIAEVDGRDTGSWSLDKAVREITGPEGTQVILGIERNGDVELIKTPLTRAEIPIESVKGWKLNADGQWDYYVDRANKIGYIRLSQFIPQSADDIDAAINQMQNDNGLEALVLDLRFNPGGLLTAAIEVTDRFVAKGDIVSTVDVDGVHTNRFRARPAHTHRDLPVVVLINQGSASASEIVAGALQDHHRALIVGQRSFGKGSVQDLIALTYNQSAYLKLTTQYYALPSKRIIHREPGADKWGIEPDLEITMTDDQVAAWLEARRDADIINNGEGNNGEDNNGEGNDDDDAPAAQKDAENADDAADKAGEAGEDENAEEIKKPATAEQILEDSLDPQLEAALLVLRTRLVAQATGMASKE